MGIVTGYLVVAIALATLSVGAAGYGLGCKNSHWVVGGTGGAVAASGLVLDAVNGGHYLASGYHIAFEVVGAVLLVLAIVPVLLRRRRTQRPTGRSSLPPSSATTAH